MSVVMYFTAKYDPIGITPAEVASFNESTVILVGGYVANRYFNYAGDAQGFHETYAEARTYLISQQQKIADEALANIEILKEMTE